MFNISASSSFPGFLKYIFPEMIEAENCVFGERSLDATYLSYQATRRRIRKNPLARWMYPSVGRIEVENGDTTRVLELDLWDAIFLQLISNYWFRFHQTDLKFSAQM